MVQIFILYFFLPFLLPFFLVMSVLPVIFSFFWSFFAMSVLPVILLCHFFDISVLTCHFFCHVSFGLSFFAMSIFACHFVVIFCHLSNIFWYFLYFVEHYTKKLQKIQNFHQMTKHDKNMASLQVAKMTFFSRHCHFFLSFRCNFLKNVQAYQKLFGK